ncbi:hypothetical protein QE407_004805 [Pantoea dispersa]|nr:hypothetical protein [Pantoea dispersa]
MSAFFRGWQNILRGKTAHVFDAELSLVFFDKDILHFRRFVEYAAAILDNGELLCLLRQLQLHAGIFSRQFAFTLRRCGLILLFAALVIELGFKLILPA